jgi:hypothetical protein
MKIQYHKGPAVTLNFDADDWQLYLAEDDYEIMERDFVAMDLNHEFEKRLLCAPTREEFELGDMLTKHSSWGAADTEGCAHVNFVLDEIYGVNDEF